MYDEVTGRKVQILHIEVAVNFEICKIIEKGLKKQILKL